MCSFCQSNSRCPAFPDAVAAERFVHVVVVDDDADDEVDY